MHTLTADRNKNAARQPKQWAIYRATVDLYLLLHRGASTRQDALEHMKQHGHGHNTIHAAAALIGVPLSAPGYVAFWSMPDPAPRLLDLLEHIEAHDRRIGKRARATRRERDRELMRRLLGGRGG